MRIYTNPSDNDIKEAAELLKNGKIVSFPTETVYGLGGNVFDTQAIARIFAVKERPHFDPLICHIADKSMVETLAYIPYPELFEILTNAFWPGPLTIILPKKECVPDLVTGGLDTVAIRMPSHPIALKLIRESTGAIAAPSANPFGYISPTRASHVTKTIGALIDAVVDGGLCEFGVESTVIDLSVPDVKILRYGALATEDIEKLLGYSLSYYSNINKLKFKSPGQIKKHYSPVKPLIQYNNSEDLMGYAVEQSGVIYFDKKIDNLHFATEYILSPTADIIEAASKLFETLYLLEESNVKTIFIVNFPEKGLGKAIQDRVKRASSR